MVLQLLGATVRIAYSGEQALSTLNAFRPNAAILDIGMRGMDGLELARRIRLLPEFRDTSLIALTGWEQKEDVRTTLRSGSIITWSSRSVSKCWRNSSVDKRWRTE